MLDDPVVFNDWHVVGRADNFGIGTVRAARLLGVDLVIWRNEGGIHVWLDQCRHRGAKLSLGKVQDACLVCRYHGWCYDSSGVCVLIPAHPEATQKTAAQAQIFPSRVQYNLVWVCLGTPAADVPVFSPWTDPTYRSVLAGPYPFAAYATRVLEDFLDAGHYPFVHASQLGGSKNFRMQPYNVTATDSGLVSDEIRVRRIWREGPGGTGEVDVTYSYKVLRPFSAQYTKSFGAECFSMLDTVTPVDEGQSLVWSVMAYNYAPGKTDRELVDYQAQLAAEDAPVVESQRPQRLPLDLGQELPVPSDRLSVAYRQWLKKIGLRFGTT